MQLCGLRLYVGPLVNHLMKPAAVGDAYFDLDAAQFLLEELQRQRQASAAAASDANGSHAAQPSGQQQAQQNGAPPQQQQPAEAGGGSGSPGVQGPAVGPRWVLQLPAGAGGEDAGGAAGLGSVQLEYGCQVARIQLAPAGGGAAQSPPPPPPQQGGGQQADAPGARPLLLTLTNGRQLEVDLVLLAIGVCPALEWVPPGLERAPDGGLRLNKCVPSPQQQACAAAYNGPARLLSPASGRGWAAPHTRPLRHRAPPLFFHCAGTCRA